MRKPFLLLVITIPALFLTVSCGENEVSQVQPASENTWHEGTLTWQGETREARYFLGERHADIFPFHIQGVIYKANGPRNDSGVEVAFEMTFDSKKGLWSEEPKVILINVYTGARYPISWEKTHKNYRQLLWPGERPMTQEEQSWFTETAERLLEQIRAAYSK